MISTERTRSEIEAMEKHARLALFYQDQQFRMAVNKTPSIRLWENLQKNMQL